MGRYWVGVPASTAAEFTLSPTVRAGKPVADHVNGGVNAPPVAVNVVAV